MFLFIVLIWFAVISFACSQVMARAHGVKTCKAGERPQNRLELIIYDFTKFTEIFAGIKVYYFFLLLENYQLFLLSSFFFHLLPPFSFASSFPLSPPFRGKRLHKSAWRCMSTDVCGHTQRHLHRRLQWSHSTCFRIKLATYELFLL